MTRFALILATAAFATPAFAEDKKETCAYQAQVVKAIQTARLERVAERDVQDHILAQSPTWPEKYNNVIPLITPWVYEQKRKVIRNEDLGAGWNELCLQQ
ncbi:MAG: hypothetical protein ABJ263_06215 [Tateyamaria sp.]|uniref:hypothetical protein n=1 Tax=Tateyamaria sp. TaxID=1929288 RepID=UPI003276278E